MVYTNHDIDLMAIPDGADQQQFVSQAYSRVTLEHYNVHCTIALNCTNPLLSEYHLHLLNPSTKQEITNLILFELIHTVFSCLTACGCE